MFELDYNCFPSEMKCYSECFKMQQLIFVSWVLKQGYTDDVDSVPLVHHNSKIVKPYSIALCLTVNKL